MNDPRADVFPTASYPRASERDPGTRGQHVLLSLVVIIMAIALPMIEATGSTWPSGAFRFYALVLAAYSLAEIALVRRFEPESWLVNPAVHMAFLGSVVPVFCLFLLAFFPEYLHVAVGFDSYPDPFKTRYEWLCLWGAVAAWSGYWSGLSVKIGRVLRDSRFVNRLLRTRLELNVSAVVVLATISVGSRLLAIQLGIYGYAANYDRLVEAGNFTQYFYILGELGKALLVAVCLANFTRASRSRHLALLIVLFSAEIAFGILSGFKSQVVVPLIIVSICYYCVRHRFPAWTVPAIAGTVILAYVLIEPFRAVRHRDVGFDGTSLYSIVESFGVNTDKVKLPDGYDGADFFLASFLARMSDVSVAGPGIEYASTVKPLPPGSPDFLRNILLAPIYSAIPRFVWSGKPVENLGLWYTQVVLGKDIVSSTAMYPVTYLYFAGGWLAVVLGFLVVGIIQGGVFRGFKGQPGSALFVLVCVVGFLGAVPSAYYAYFISLIRYVPLVLVFQYVLFRGPATE